jgi:hypothetical protein
MVSFTVEYSVADPHHVDPDSNPACHFDVDLDPAFSR